jgi:hypothetical protein
VLGYRSRRKRGMPKEMELEFSTDGRQEAKRVPLSEGVAIVPMPVFERPGYMRADKTEDLRAPKLQMILVGQDPATMLRQYAADRIAKTARLDVLAFARLLAKIAYSYVAAAGLRARTSRRSGTLDIASR